jgi:hypothetical protein
VVVVVCRLCRFYLVFVFDDLVEVGCGFLFVVVVDGAFLRALLANDYGSVVPLTYVVLRTRWQWYQ